MDLDQLKQQWQKLDEKVSAALHLNARLLQESTAARTRTYLGREPWLILPELLLNFIAVVLVGSFLGDHVREPRFFVPGLALMAFAIFIFATDVRHLAMVLHVDYAAPVLTSQRRLQQIKIERVRRFKLVLLLAPLLWTPLFIVALKGLLGVDPYRVFGWLYIAANLLFGIAAIPIVIWLSRRYGQRLAGRPLLKRLADDLGGRNLAAALSYLESLTAYEDEKATMIP